MISKKISLEAILALVIIAPFLVISFYNHAALDDWWYAGIYKTNGLWGAQSYWYQNYTARFFSNFLMTLAPLSFGWIEGNKIMPVLFIFLLFITFYYASSILMKEYPASKLALSLWITVTYLLIQRDYFECLYWLSANVVYQYPMLLFILQALLIYQGATRQKNLFYSIIIIFLSIAIVGSNEVLGGLVLAELCLLAVFAFYFNRFKVASTVLVIVVLGCWAFMLTAPGNWSKISELERERLTPFSLSNAIKYSIISSGYYTLFLIKQPSVWCLVLLATPVIRHSIKKFFSFVTMKFTVALAACALISLTMYFISIYPSGVLIPPLRITNLAMIFLFLGMVVFVAGLSEKLSVVNKAVLFLIRKKKILMLICLFSAALTPTKYNQLLTDLISGKASTYNSKMYNRYSILRNTDSDTLVLNKLTNVPRTIIATDISGQARKNIDNVFNKNIEILMR